MCICEKCQKEHDGSYASGRFCSSFCARSYSSFEKREEINRKVSKTLKDNGKGFSKGFDIRKDSEESRAKRLVSLRATNLRKKLDEKIQSELWIKRECARAKRKIEQDKRKTARAEKERIVKLRPEEEIVKLLLSSIWDSLSGVKKRRRRVLEEQMYVCAGCSNNLWMGLKIMLEIHHIDGNPKNNDRSNLCLLCRNCHSQTENYGSKRREKATPENNVDGARS
jgi:5-methylcytosine-specific restriction endonuclease McrA